VQLLNADYVQSPVLIMYVNKLDLYSDQKYPDLFSCRGFARAPTCRFKDVKNIS
jgi:hypothetical protein